MALIKLKRGDHERVEIDAPHVVDPLKAAGYEVIGPYDGEALPAGTGGLADAPDAGTAPSGADASDLAGSDAGGSSDSSSAGSSNEGTPDLAGNESEGTSNSGSNKGRNDRRDRGER